MYEIKKHLIMKIQAPGSAWFSVQMILCPSPSVLRGWLLGFWGCCLQLQVSAWALNELDPSL